MPVRIQSLHHVALPVSDLERAAKFYREVLGLEELERPHFSFAGKWYRLAGDQQLHLIDFRHLLQQINLIVEKCAVENRNDGLGRVDRQRAQPSAFAPGKQDGLHDKLPSYTTEA